MSMTEDITDTIIATSIILTFGPKCFILYSFSYFFFLFLLLLLLSYVDFLFSMDRRIRVKTDWLSVDFGLWDWTFSLRIDWTGLRVSCEEK
jgi:hypothetical protein